MENTVKKISFRCKYDLEFKIIKYRAGTLAQLLKCNKIEHTIIFEENLAVVTIPQLTICSIVNIRNLIKYYKIYE